MVIVFVIHFNVSQNPEIVELSQTKKLANLVLLFFDSGRLNLPYHSY